MFEMRYHLEPGLLDPEYRHLHHARSLEVLEKARLGYLEWIGYPNESFLRQGLFPVVTRIDVHYKREVRSGELRVQCSHPRIDGRQFTFDQALFNQQGKLAVEARVECMIMSGATKRAIEVPAEFIEAIGRKG